MWALDSKAYSGVSPQRDVFEGYWETLRSRKDVGFLQLAERASFWEDAESRAREARSKASRMVVLGMGGSSLGARAFLQACQGIEGAARSVLFLDNVDALSFFRQVRWLSETQQVHWVLVSKSGTTLETLAMANYLGQHLAKDWDKFLNHITVVTEKTNNPLHQWAQKNQVKVLDIPLDVGGRFSAFTPAGLLPMAFAGKDLELIRGGMVRAQEKASSFAFELAAQYLESFRDEKWIHIMWPYVDDLLDMGLWFQQLWAESLGKATGRQGGAAPRVSTPMVLRGASDQHSVLQQVMEGARDKIISFLRVRRSEDFGPELTQDLFGVQADLVGKKLGAVLFAEAEATRGTLASSGVPCLSMSTLDLTEESVAFFMQSYMIVVGLLGEALGLNAFDQPGVEAGKIKAKEILSRLSTT